MKFLIKEISPSRTEIRITLNSVEKNNLSYYIFGDRDGNFDEGSIGSQYIPEELSNFLVS